MKKLNIFFLATMFLAGNIFAQLASTEIDQLGVDFEQRYYGQNTIGPQITIDNAGDVHVVYMKSFIEGTDTNFTLLYKNLTQGTMDTIRPQQPEKVVSPSRVLIAGGHGGDVYVAAGPCTYRWQWGEMSYSQMSKIGADGKEVPLGVQEDLTVGNGPQYNTLTQIIVSPVDGIAHILSGNVSGNSCGYWNFDGTNFGEIYAMYHTNSDKDIPGKDVNLGYYAATNTKGVDVAVSKDGSTVAVGGLHQPRNIDITFGSFGGNLWPDDFETALDDGSFVYLFDTTGVNTGENLPDNEAKPATDLQLAYDDNDVLHVVYEAEYFSQHLDTLSDGGMKARNNGVDNFGGWHWWSTYINWAGDTNAVYSSNKPKPQLRYWNNGMPVWAKSVTAHTLIAESVYPMAGEDFKWFHKGVIDSGLAYWGNRASGLIEDIDLIVNTNQAEGEAAAVLIWEEMMSAPTVYHDTTHESYYSYYKDILYSTTNDFITWTTPVNLTNTPTVDEGDVSAYRDVVDGKVHFLYRIDDLPGSDYWNKNNPEYEDYYVSGNSITLRKDQNVKLMHGILDIVTDVEDAVVPGKFELAQNYPNPFNPTTSISFSIPAKSDVSIKVYNNIGQLVTTLVSGVKEAGSHKASWNAASVSSGVYFYTINAGEFTSTKKMILLK